VDFRKRAHPANEPHKPERENFHQIVKADAVKPVTLYSGVDRVVRGRRVPVLREHSYRTSNQEPYTALCPLCKR
jgi:hypothetical protein